MSIEELKDSEDVLRTQTLIAEKKAELQSIKESKEELRDRREKLIEEIDDLENGITVFKFLKHFTTRHLFRRIAGLVSLDKEE